MKMRFLSDESITKGSQDILGFGDFVKLIQDALYHTEATSFVYGVLGDWGSGKTSILRLLEERLEKDLEIGARAFVPIWFEAWKYENEANIVYPLLYAIRRDYDERVGGFDEAKGFGKKFLRVVVTSSLALADVAVRAASKHFIDDAMTLEDIAKHLETVQEHPGELGRVLGSWADQVRDLRKVFESLLDTYAKDLGAKETNISRDDVRFVILVDDLDRCLPGTAIAVLESIKNHLVVENCIFVLALNAQVIYQGIRTKYQGLEIDGREYLEKILNYSFYVPEPTLDRVANFASRRLEELVPNDQDRQKYQSHFEDFGKILQVCGFSNPRKIKRVLNRFLLFINTAEVEKRLSDYNMSNVTRLIVLAEYFPVLFTLLLGKDNPKSVCDKLANSNKAQIGEEYGISIPASYAPLFKLQELFNLEEDGLGLRREVEAVHRITRLI